MKEAIKVYSEILRCYDAIKKTKSEKLKNDYYKHINREKKELLMYCQYRHINLVDVANQYEHSLHN